MRSMLNKYPIILALMASIAFMALFGSGLYGCGHSSYLGESPSDRSSEDDQDAQSTSTVSVLNGNLLLPFELNISVPAAQKVHLLNEGVAEDAGYTVEVYDMEGNFLGSNIAGVDGSFSVEIDLDFLSTSFAEPLFISAVSPQGDNYIIDLYRYDPTSFSGYVGSVNIVDTIASIAVLDVLGISRPGLRPQASILSAMEDRYANLTALHNLTVEMFNNVPEWTATASTDGVDEVVSAFVGAALVGENEMDEFAEIASDADGAFADVVRGRVTDFGANNEYAFNTASVNNAAISNILNSNVPFATPLSSVKKMAECVASNRVLGFANNIDALWSILNIDSAEAESVSSYVNRLTDAFVQCSESSDEEAVVFAHFLGEAWNAFPGVRSYLDVFSDRAEDYTVSCEDKCQMLARIVLETESDMGQSWAVQNGLQTTETFMLKLLEDEDFISEPENAVYVAGAISSNRLNRCFGGKGSVGATFIVDSFVEMVNSMESEESDHLKRSIGKALLDVVDISFDENIGFTTNQQKQEWGKFIQDQVESAGFYIPGLWSDERASSAGTVIGECINTYGSYSPQHFQSLWED